MGLFSPFTMTWAWETGRRLVPSPSGSFWYFERAGTLCILLKCRLTGKFWSGLLQMQSKQATEGSSNGGP